MILRILLFFVGTSAYAGFDLNLFVGYESAQRTFSREVGSETAESKVKMTGIPYGLNGIFFFEKLPVGFGLQFLGGSSTGSADYVKHTLTSMKLSGILKIWNPKSKRRVNPYLGLRYGLFGKDTYTQSYEATISGFGDITNKYSGKSSSYGLEVGANIAMNKRFYFSGALSISKDQYTFSTIDTETGSGSASTDVVDNSKLEGMPIAILLGVGMTWGGGR